MNKRELIGKIIDLPYEAGVATDTLKINRAGLIKLIDQFDEPQKVTIPQFVADWITKAKTEGLKRKNSLGSYEELFPSDSAYSAMFSIFIKGFAIGEVRNWVAENADTFALAWINGYEVAKEKRYIVKVKGAEEGYNYLNCRISLNEYFFSGESEPLDFRVKHTREMLEKAGFGWVFDCEGIEVKEVKE